MATTQQLIALGNDAAFRQRVRILALQIAAQVYGEDSATPNHNVRVQLAFKLFTNPGTADAFATVLATRTNLSNSTVTYNFQDAQIQTDATDAAILSQLATDWAMLAGI